MNPQPTTGTVSDFPRWHCLVIKLRSKDLYEPVRNAIAPICAENLARAEVRSWSFMPYLDESSFYVNVEPAANVDSGNLLRVLRQAADDPRWAKTAESVVLETFTGMTTRQIGGAAFLELFCDFHAALSTATIDIFNLVNERSEGEGLMYFAVACTTLILDALSLSTEDRRKCLDHCVTSLMKFMGGFGPGDPRFEKAFAMVSDSNERIKSCFQGALTNWNEMESLVSDTELRIYRKLDRELREKSRGFTKERAALWTQSLEFVVAKRLIHLQWLRVYHDNLKESMVLEWLKRQ